MRAVCLLFLILSLSYALEAEKTVLRTVGISAVDLNAASLYNLSESAASSVVESSTLDNGTCLFDMVEGPDGCQCQNTFGGILLCNDSGGHPTKPKIRRAHWIGYHNTSGNLTLVGGLCKFCMSAYAPKVGNYVDWNPSSQCVKNRNGTLCSKCVDGTAPAVNSHKYECVKCNNFNFFWFVLIQITCLSLLMLFIYVFDFFPASGALNSAVFFAQAISSTLQPNGVGYIPLQSISNNSAPRADDVLDMIYSIWNLDFVSPVIPPFCYFEQMNMMAVLAVNCAIALLPLLLVVIILLVHILRECCGRFLKPCDEFWSLLGSRIPCRPGPILVKITGYDAERSKQTLFASALLLSYTKFFINTLYILTPATLFDPYGNAAGRVNYLYGEWEFSETKHLYYAIPALCIGVLMFIGFPLSLLILRYDMNGDVSSQGPRNKPARCASFFNKMVDHYLLYPFQRDFKWGRRKRKPCSTVKWWKLSWGLHDYRWMAGWYFLLRLSLFATFTISIDFMVQIVVQQLICVLGVIVSVSLRPYRYWLHNRIDACIFLLLASINTLSMYQYYWSSIGHDLSYWAFVVQYSIAFIPAAMMAYYFFAKLHTNWTTKHLALPGVGDDFTGEPYSHDDSQLDEDVVHHRNVNNVEDHSSRTPRQFLSSLDTVHRVPVRSNAQEVNVQEVNVADLHQSGENGWLAHNRPKKNYTFKRLCSCRDLDNPADP